MTGVFWFILCVAATFWLGAMYLGYQELKAMNKENEEWE